MRRGFLLFGALLGLQAAGPATWEMSQYSEFSKGKLRGISLTRAGVLEPGLRIDADPALATGESSLWSIASAADGTKYLGTGPRGRIFSWLPGQSKLEAIGSPAAGHVFSLAVDRSGVLYAGVSPGGQIYRRQGKAWELYASTGARFIWSMLCTPDGALFVGTGDEGKLFRVSEGKVDLWWESGQASLTSLSIDRDSSLLVGSDPNGILYRLTGKNTARTIFDAPFAEIRSVVSDSDGGVNFLAMGGAAAKRGAGVNQAAPGGVSTGIPQVTTTITVTDEASAQAGIDLKPKTQAQVNTPVTSPATATTSIDIPGVDRSAIYRLNQDGSVDQLLVTKEESIFDIAWQAGKLHFASDNHGRFYRLDADRQATLLAESGESEIGRIVGVGSEFIGLGTSSGRLLRFSSQPASEGEYESPVHEAPTISRWGMLTPNSGANITFEARSGNSTRPDSTWSNWEAVSASKIASPAARYLQWRMKSKGTFSLRAVTANYLPRNQAPIVKSITAALNVSASKTPTATNTSASSAVYTLTVTDTGEASSSTSAGTSAILPTRPLSRQLFLSWTSEDPDADTMEYRIEYRAEDETAWKLLKEHLPDTSYFVDADTLADARYFFRVIASDAPANTISSARSGELTSVPIHLDQTPPELSLTLADGRISIRATDQASAIRRLEYSIDSGPWQGLDAADGILDSSSERASITLAELRLGPGEHTITVRALDAALNAAIRKLTSR